ncbi:FAR1 DNA-binding domain protein [Ceratocystis platani]|uniref:FAR1 DNA-binding domain protein n=1 Tax=Ceratocystis fimbriata f. sp. platani TaxID=88771 RepID=A0A0F8D9G3_CERFI|nr:FAR1 DNA-binding domain protein [Ceratocystis platani]
MSDIRTTTAAAIFAPVGNAAQKLQQQLSQPLLEPQPNPMLSGVLSTDNDVREGAGKDQEVTEQEKSYGAEEHRLAGEESEPEPEPEPEPELGPGAGSIYTPNNDDGHVADKPCGPPPPTNVTYPTFEAAHTAVVQHAEASGYALAIRRKYPNKAKFTRVDFKCSKGGERRMVVRDGEEVSVRAVDTQVGRRRQTPTLRSGCPFVFKIAYNYKYTSWQITYYSDPKTREHNHGFVQPVAFAPYRQKILALYRDHIVEKLSLGMKPTNIVCTIPEVHRHLIMSRDIRNLAVREKVLQRDKMLEEEQSDDR